jgi:hypothetical protein
MGLKLITPPSSEPVSLDTAKSFLRVLITDDDDLISSMITAARMYCEKYTNLEFMGAQWRQTFDIFPIYSGLQFPFPFFQQLPESAVYQAGNYGYLQTPNYGVLSPPDFTKLTLPNWGMIGMPKPPLQSIDSIEYLDQNGNLQTLDPDNYVVVEDNFPGYVKPVVNGSNTVGWPAVQPNTSDAVRVTFTSGFARVPGPICIAILLMVGQWYESRQPSESGAAVEQAVHHLLDRYAFEGFF